MSFSSDIKLVLSEVDYECPDCREAELSGFFTFTGKLSARRARLGSGAAARRAADALLSRFGIEPEDGVCSEEDTARLRAELSDAAPKRGCCRLAYIRGAFLGGGSVSDPKKEYHLEFAAGSEDRAERLIGILSALGFEPRLTKRRSRPVVYMKESSGIAELIGYISDGRAGLEIFSAQVEKAVKGDIQRQVNCDSANLGKQARASAGQIKAINKLKAARKWHTLPDVLREIGELRLKYPDLSLEELGRLTEQKIGKSGVNHRLKRIMEKAEGLQ